MKKLLFLLGFALVITAENPSYYTADVINQSPFQIRVRVFRPGASADERPKPAQEYTTEWNLRPGVAKYNQKMGWKDQYTYNKLDVLFTVNYGDGDITITQVYDLPKKLQTKNDFIATIDIQKKTGKEGISYIDSLLARAPYSWSSSPEHQYLKNQKTKGWAWVPKVTIQPKS
jgi:hypothetical protein